jgi:hypothetical protein
MLQSWTCLMVVRIHALRAEVRIALQPDFHPQKADRDGAVLALSSFLTGEPRTFPGFSGERVAI